MNIRKYFWELNRKALLDTGRVLRNPKHPRFMERIFTLLSRCDNPDELFSVLSKEQFVEEWPRIRQYWAKRAQAQDFRAWWETIYEHLLKKEGAQRVPKGEPMAVFVKTGEILKEARLKKGWSQSDFARRARMNQPDISAIERGKKNMTIETLVRLCKTLGIKNLSLDI